MLISEVGASLGGLISEFSALKEGANKTHKVREEHFCGTGIARVLRTARFPESLEPQESPESTSRSEILCQKESKSRSLLKPLEVAENRF